MPEQFSEEDHLEERLYRSIDIPKRENQIISLEAWEQEPEAADTFGAQKLQPQKTGKDVFSRRHLLAAVGGTFAGTLLIESGALALWESLSGTKGLQTVLNCISSTESDQTATPTTSAQVSRHHWPLVKYDVHNEHNAPGIVSVVQHMLKARQYDIGPEGVDGAYGKSTFAAVQAFQKSVHLESHGIVDSRTWEQLILPSKKNNQGSHVLALHERLATWGISPSLQKKRTFNEQTEAAVSSFQQQHPPLSVNGEADLDTWCLLVGGTLFQHE